MNGSKFGYLILCWILLANLCKILTSQTCLEVKGVHIGTTQQRIFIRPQLILGREIETHS